MSDRSKHMTIIFGIIFCLVLLCFLVVLWGIIDLQYIHKTPYINYAEQQLNNVCTLHAKRGNIYDSEGRLVAANISRYRLIWDTSLPALQKGGDTVFTDHINEICEGLSQIIGDSTASYYQMHMRKGLREKKPHFIISYTRVTHKQLEEINKLPLFRLGQYTGGTYVEENNSRENPFGVSAYRTIGRTYTESNRGNCGLEMQYDSILRGTDGKGLRQKVAHITMPIPIEKPVQGKDIVTTLDMEMQDIVESSLKTRLDTTHAQWACCILMEVSTGEIKAMSNLTRQNDGSYSETMNYAVSRVEPGSTFKTVALMAALDDKKTTLDQRWDAEGGRWVYRDPAHPITDSHAMWGLTTRQGLAASSNIVLAKIITRAYEGRAKNFVKKLDEMGICENIGIEIPGATPPRIDIPKDAETMARMSFGYSVELPPVYTLMFYNAIANNGQMIAPFLVKEIQENGKPIETHKAKVIRQKLCSESTLKDIQTCLQSVVWDSIGTASCRPWSRKAQSKRVHIAGKTGTARILQSGHYLTQHRISFCGYFPMENPKYTCICVMQAPTNPGYDAGIDCGGTVRVIAERIMSYKGDQPIDSIITQDTNPMIKSGQYKALETAAEGSCINLQPCQGEWAKANDQMEARSLPIRNDIVPRVIGMGAKDAVFAIEKTGMIARIYGTGTVKNQSVPAGSKPKPGETIYLTLE